MAGITIIVMYRTELGVMAGLAMHINLSVVRIISIVRPCLPDHHVSASGGGEMVCVVATDIPAMAGVAIARCRFATGQTDCFAIGTVAGRTAVMDLGI